MNLAKLDRVSDKLNFLFQYISSLKEENRKLKRQVYGLELNLAQTRAKPESSEARTKFTELAAERDRLMAEREMIRVKLKAVIEKVNALEHAEPGQ